MDMRVRKIAAICILLFLAVILWYAVSRHKVDTIEEIMSLKSPETILSPEEIAEVSRIMHAKGGPVLSPEEQEKVEAIMSQKSL